MSENPAEFGHSEGIEEATGEEGLVVLDAEKRNEGEASKGEKSTRRQGCEI